MHDNEDDDHSDERNRLTSSYYLCLSTLGLSLHLSTSVYFFSLPTVDLH